MHVSLTDGAREVAGHEMADRPGIGSVTVTGSKVTLPVLVTLYEYVTRVPGDQYDLMLADFFSAMDGLFDPPQLDPPVDAGGGAVPVAVVGAWELAFEPVVMAVGEAELGVVVGGTVPTAVVGVTEPDDEDGIA